MNKNNPYGYKIGYRENGRPFFHYRFVSASYNQAVSMRNFYRRYEPKHRERTKINPDPFWEIQPITKKEFLGGIWNENPF